ncbi:hypothetical protein Tco_1360061 [Tanacetum coccineum]
METEANDLDHLVNYDNDNDINDLGYESEVYLDEEEEEDENNHSNGNVVKSRINRLSMFRREYGKPDGIKLSVTFDALNRISGSHRALFLSFLGDLRYFDVDLTFRKLVMNRLGQLLRNFRSKLRQTYILPNQDTLSKLNEVPVKYSAILKAEEWVKSAAAKMGVPSLSGRRKVHFWVLIDFGNIITNSRVMPSWREIVSLTFSEAGVLHVNWTSLGHCVSRKALSQRIEIGDIGLDHNGISMSKFFNHSASLPAAVKAINLDSIVEPMMQVCFLKA